MLFNSASFLFFFAAVSALYFLLPHRFRWILLLSFSCYFYMCFIPVYILLLFYMIAVDYTAGLLMEKWNGRPRLRKWVLIASIASNLGVLFFFKYWGFFDQNLSALAKFLGWNYPMKALHLILPLGLSFHTFQSLSYVLSVYRGHLKAERHLGIFALFIMFYPQLTAGPIERAEHMLPQFHQKYNFDYTRVVNGLKLMTWGFFQKLVIADRVSLYVNTVYGNPRLFDGIELAAATVFFAFQIYCDFCGYTNIARGAAEVMGFNLVRNFEQPYLAQSLPEFWRRWHISLSSWFRDYVYIPLGGNRKGPVRHAVNLLITFTLSGLWHGASWTFVWWGAFHGIFMILSRVTQNVRRTVAAKTGLPRFPFFYGVFKTLITFMIVCAGWVFFRANTMEDAFYIFKNLFGPGTDWRLASVAKAVEFYHYDYFVAIAAITLMLYVEGLRKNGVSLRFSLSQRPALFRWAVYYGLVFTVWFWGATDVKQFIYFQF